MPTVKTKWFANSMAGAPALSGSVGAMISVLDACLKDGFNLLTLDSLVVAGNVATCSKAAHGYVVNQVVLVAGASPAGLNGEWVVTEVTSGAFKFATTGISDQTATGTITAKAAHCGWEKQFSGTNLAVYRSGDVLSTRLPIKVDDTVGQYSSVLLAEGFTDISTPVNSCVTHYFKKSSTTDATARPWLLIADGKTFYLGVDWNSNGTYDFVSFGDFASLVAGDGYCARLQGFNVIAPTAKGHGTSHAMAAWEDASGALALPGSPRSYAQTIGLVALYQGSLCACSMVSGANSISYPWAVSGNHGFSSTPVQLPLLSPSLSDSGYHFVPVFLAERPASGRTLRGSQRGLLHVLEQTPISSSYQLLSGVENVPGAKVLMVASAGHIWNGANVLPAATLAFSIGDWS